MTFGQSKISFVLKCLDFSIEHYLFFSIPAPQFFLSYFGSSEKRITLCCQHYISMMVVNELFHAKTVFSKHALLATTFTWVIKQLPNSSERNLAGSVEDVITRIDKRLRGIKIIILYQP